jgi:hypothetical protein
VDESIRTSGRLVQGVAAALLHMHQAERSLFIRPLITLIERVVDGDTDPISTSSMPANWDLHPSSMKTATPGGCLRLRAALTAEPIAPAGGDGCPATTWRQDHTRIAAPEADSSW